MTPKAEPTREEILPLQRLAWLPALWRDDAHSMMIIADHSDSPEREEYIEQAKVLNDCADAIERKMAGEQPVVPRQLRGLERVCKMMGSMKCGDVLMVWDYAADKAVPESEMKPGSERWKLSERLYWKQMREALEIL